MFFFQNANNSTNKNSPQDPELAACNVSNEKESLFNTATVLNNTPPTDSSLGFFLTPPECPLADPIPSDSSPVAFKNYGSCEFCCHNSGESSKFDMGNCNYLAYPYPTPMFHDPCNLDTLLMDNCNPNLIYTDVGVIPMYDNNSDVERLLHNISNISSPRWEVSENRNSSTKHNNK